MSENTRLLHNPKENPYARFSSFQKRIIVGIVAFSGIMTRKQYIPLSRFLAARLTGSLFKAFAASSFVPCVPEVAKDLNTTGEVINFTAVGLYMFMLVTLTKLPSRWSTTHLPDFSASHVSRLFNSLAIDIGGAIDYRPCFTGIAASCFISVGVSSISDIYKLEERGTAIEAYYAAVLLGLAIAPMTGGIAAIYASWRLIPIIIFGISLSSLISVIMFSQRHVTQEAEWVWLNPFQSLKLLRGPNVSFVAIATACAFMTNYVMLISLSYTIGPRYGLTSPALIGACFLPSGLGSTLGSPIVGRISDKIIISKCKQRGGKWLPEDRLLATLPGAIFLVPLSVLMYGIAIQFIPGKIGLIICFMCLFANGVGLVMVIGPSGTYTVDILQTQTAEAIVVISGMRSFVVAQASAFALPLIESIGVVATCALAAGVAWFGFALLLITIIYGTRLRKWVDLGYTTTADGTS
ncbi:hypothetical protein M422DRAFT_272715 [Sphaerobolus stellatus SS14]|uniref:Major facilitator superfamily (MFS) profile domain-containing protein n=1 Tax=Sphaerobolus stellatus (strain SS14) TaxID=990650 RepID=A0A0C9ULS1_SPHS4|nr:hypothetical protein M422DRAFT_272715 [Sphaerobolus stellatus SS14]